MYAVCPTNSSHPAYLITSSLFFQPNYVQSLHNLLLQTTSNDTGLVKAVRLVILHIQFIPIND